VNTKHLLTIDKQHWG